MRNFFIISAFLFFSHSLQDNKSGFSTGENNIWITPLIQVKEKQKKFTFRLISFPQWENLIYQEFPLTKLGKEKHIKLGLTPKLSHDGKYLAFLQTYQIDEETKLSKERLIVWDLKSGILYIYKFSGFSTWLTSFNWSPQEGTLGLFFHEYLKSQGQLYFLELKVGRKKMVRFMELPISNPSFANFWAGEGIYFPYRRAKLFAEGITIRDAGIAIFDIARREVRIRSANWLFPRCEVRDVSFLSHSWWKGKKSFLAYISVTFPLFEQIPSEECVGSEFSLKRYYIVKLSIPLESIFIFPYEFEYWVVGSEVPKEATLILKDYRLQYRTKRGNSTRDVAIFTYRKMLLLGVPK